MRESVYITNHNGSRRSSREKIKFINLFYSSRLDGRRRVSRSILGLERETR